MLACLVGNFFVCDTSIYVFDAWVISLEQILTCTHEYRVTSMVRFYVPCPRILEREEIGLEHLREWDNEVGCTWVMASISMT